MDLAAWLRALDLERYIEAFEANDIDPDLLRTLNASDLKELGITSLGHRKKLLEAISALRAQTSAAPLPDAPAPPTPVERQEAERRQFTVMFCDLVGSTALSARLDPEDMRDVIRAYQNTVAGEITRFEGHVAKFMGDGVLAYFGYPRAHEDDAKRAVRAGLALTEAVGELQTPADRALAVRIGIATGLVVVGDLVGEGAAQEQAVVGDTPNLAARLQGVAKPGTVVIAETTRRLVGAGFDLADLGAQALRGLAEPVAERSCRARGREVLPSPWLRGLAEPVSAFAVTGERAVESRFEAHVGASVLPMVGRDQELALLLERWRQAKSGEGQGVLLVGEAGIGKSRIIRAVLDALVGEPHTRLRYQSSPFHTDSAMWPVVQQLSHAAELVAADPADTKLDKLETLLGQAPDSPEATPLIADLLGLDGVTRYGEPSLTPQAQRSRTLEALVDQLLGLAAQQPVLMVLEDAHWIDPSTLELVEQSLDRIADARVLILLTSRPDHEPALAAHPHVTRLTLNRLGRAGVEAIVARLGGDHLSGETIDMIIARTDGVPLFVEELTKAVLETGEAAIPASLHDSLMARLDRTPEVKEIAQIAACIGREFPQELLAAVAPMSPGELGEALQQLVSFELVFRRGVAPNARFSFKHALVRDAAYASLLRSRRQQLHAEIAYALENRSSEVTETAPEVLAHHFEFADLPVPTIRCLRLAGEQAIRRSAYAEAVEHLRRALHLLSKQSETAARDREELDLLATIGPVLIALEGYASQAVDRTYMRARLLCERLDEPTLLSVVLRGIYVFHLIRADYQRSREAADNLVSLAQERSDSSFVLEGCRALGTINLFIGEMETARSDLEKGVSLYDKAAHRTHSIRYGNDPEVVLLSCLTEVLWHLGLSDQSAHTARRALA